MYLAWFLYTLMMFLTLILMLMDKIEVRLFQIDKETGNEVELPEIFRYFNIMFKYSLASNTFCKYISKFR